MKFGPKEIKELNEYLRTGRNRKREFLGGGITFASDLTQPMPKKEIVEIDAINAFMKRNPRADGGRIGFEYGGVAGLYKQKNGSFRLLARNKNAGVNVDEYFKASEESKALKRGKEIQKIIKESTKGFLTRAELGKKIGVKASAIERYKVNNTDAYKKIKELFEIKKGGETSPELYKPKSKTAISDLKKIVAVGNVKPKKTYGGKKTTIQKVRDVLNNSDKALTETEIVKKIKGVPKDTIRFSINSLIKEDQFKNKIKRIGTDEGAAKVAQVKAEKRVPMMTAIRNQFVADPDSDLEDVARAIYGDKKFNAADNILKAEYLKDASRQVPKFLAMFAPGSKLKYPGFKNIKPDKLGEILTSIEIRTNDFGFEPGVLRQLRVAIADAARGLPERTTEKMMTAVRQPKKAVDEVAGVAASFERAPGYIEATQIIDPKINAIKGKRLDPEFSRVFGNALAGDFSEVNKYNKKAKDFGKKYNIDVPIIKTGKNLKPEKIISNFEEFSPGAQKNIKDIAKQSNVVVQTKSKPLSSIFKSLPSQAAANPFFSPGVLGEAFKTIPTPAGAVALNLGLGVDPTSSIDRASIAAEAAFAPQLVKQSAKFGPVAQRFFNLGLTPAMAARVARIASPLGIASLGAEGAYQLGKFTKKRINELRSMTPEQREELRRQGEAQAFDPFQAAGGGIAKQAGDPSGAPPEKGPNSQGLPGLLKRVKKQ